MFKFNNEQSSKIRNWDGKVRFYDHISLNHKHKHIFLNIIKMKYIE